MSGWKDRGHSDPQSVREGYLFSKGENEISNQREETWNDTQKARLQPLKRNMLFKRLDHNGSGEEGMDKSIRQGREAGRGKVMASQCAKCDANSQMDLIPTTEMSSSWHTTCLLP